MEWLLIIWTTRPFNGLTIERFETEALCRAAIARVIAPISRPHPYFSMAPGHATFDPSPYVASARCERLS